MRLKTLCALTAISLTFSAGAMAQGIPVYDAASYTQFLTQLNQMAQDYQKQIEQLNEAAKQTNALTGTRNMGSLYNSSLQSDLRRYLPDTWHDAMDMSGATGLGSAGAGTQGIYRQLYGAYQPVKGSDYITNDPSGSAVLAHDRYTDTTFAAMAAGEAAYNSIPDRLETYESLLGELDSTQDLKASVDLLSRISAENGLILNEMMRLNAIQMQQTATRDNQTLSSSKRAYTANQYNPQNAAKAFANQE